MTEPVHRGAVRAASTALSLALLLALATFLVPYLPFQDLPAHGGLIALRERLRHAGSESAFYVLDEQLNPYFVFRVTGDLLARVLGPVGAVRVLGFLPVVLIPFALAKADQRVSGVLRTEALAIGLLVALGFMTLMGFASFLLAMAFYTFLVGLSLTELERSEDEGATASNGAWKRRASLAALTAALVLVHGHAFLLLGLTLACFFFARPNRRAAKHLFLTLAPAALFALFLFVRQNLTIAPAAAAKIPYAPLGTRFQGPLAKLGLLATPTLFSRFGIDALIALTLVVYAAAIVFVASRNFRSGTLRQRRLLIAIGAFSLLFVGLPHSIGWFGFVDGRLLMPIIFLVVLLRGSVIDGGARASGARDSSLVQKGLLHFEHAAPFFALIQAVVVVVATFLFQTEAREFSTVAHLVPADARLLYLPFRSESRFVTGHPFLHYDKLILAEHPLVVSQFWWHQGTGIYPTEKSPAIAIPRNYLELDQGKPHWDRMALDSWTHVLVRGSDSVPEQAHLILQSGDFRLYSRVAEARN